MLGIGPMLPVLPSADNVQRSSKKSRKRGGEFNPSVGSHELAMMRRPSTIRTDSTLIESCEHRLEPAKTSSSTNPNETTRELITESIKESAKEPANLAHQQCDLPLALDTDIHRVVKQLRNGNISELELSLFAFWIKASNENYTVAKALVRELALDQVSSSVVPFSDRKADEFRAITSTRSATSICASYSRKYMISGQGLYPQNSLVKSGSNV